MPAKLLIATTNPGKVLEIQHEFDRAGLHDLFLIRGLKDLPNPLPDCIEDRPTFIGNATKKARHFAHLANCLALADDSGLCVDALHGAPGVISARYAGIDGPRELVDNANNKKLMDALQNTPDDQRQAQFVCAMALASPQNHGTDLALMLDHVDGTLLREPRGSNGFGYDPYFFFPQFQRTTAQLSLQEKSHISHRGKALRRMIHWIHENAHALDTASGATG